MSTLKRINRWWSDHAWGVLTIAVGLVAFFIVAVWMVSSEQNRQQADRIDTLESAAESLGEALDKQRDAAADHGAPVVVPDSEHIKENVESGKDGIDGTDGVDGATGPSGPPGPPGRDGKDGADGSEGSPGTDGTPGPVGPSGSTGQDGTPGANGADGAQGPAGPPGPAGAQGPQGEQGEKGDRGEPGATGPAPSKWTFTFAGVTYTCTPASEGSTEYTCEGQGPLPAPGENQNMNLASQPAYHDRRWYALRG